MPNTLDFLKRDARHLQILWLGSFLIYGVFFLNWNTNLFYYVSVLLGALLTQGFFIYRLGIPKSSLKSALITALGLCLLLKVNQPWIGFFAGMIAVSGKFLFRFRGKHIWNPANLGIIASILLFQGWVSPGQWGNEVVTLFLIASAGMLVTAKVHRMDTGVAFLATLFACEWMRSCWYQGWPIDHVLHSFSSGTLILFAFFMITDPMTSPNHRQGRLIWGSMLAVASFILSSYVQLYTSPIWALFAFCTLTPVFDHFFVKPKFQWI